MVCLFFKIQYILMSFINLIKFILYVELVLIELYFMGAYVINIFQKCKIVIFYFILITRKIYIILLNLMIFKFLILLQIINFDFSFLTI